MNNHEHGPNGPEMPQDRAGWEDRLVDRALHELHGDRPPDLLAAIERRLLEPAAGETGIAVLPRPGGAGVRLYAALLAAAALLFMAVGLAIHWSGAGRERVPAVQVAMEVIHGRLELIDGSVPAAAPRALGPGVSELVLLQRGDRLRSPRGSEETELVIGPFGMVRMAPQTLMEVKEMNVSLQNGWVAAGSLTFAVVAGAASWHLITHREHAEAGEVLKLEAPQQAALQSQLQSAQSELDKLRQEHKDLQQRYATLEQQAHRQPVAVPEVRPSSETKAETPAPVVAPAFTFDDERVHDALAKVDWQAMGGASKELTGLLVQLAAALEKTDLSKGDPAMMAMAAKIQELNAQLVKQLPALMKADLPGTGPNGVFTHPLVVGNQLASMLAQANLPLSDTERAALDGLVRHYSLENTSVAQQQNDFNLQGVIAELAMKDRFYSEVAAQLSPDQVAAMYPEGSDRYGNTSLFSSGIVWSTLTERLSVNNPADYARSTASSLGSRLELDAAASQQVQAIVEEVSRTAPAAMWQAGSTVESAGFLRRDRAPLAAQTQVAWMQRVMREVPLTDEQRTRLRQLRQVFVPVPR